MTRLEPQTSSMPANAASAAIAESDARDTVYNSILQHPFVQNVVPFLTSLSVHAGIVILALLMYTAIKIIRPPLQQQPPPLATDMVTDTGIPHFPGVTHDPLSQVVQTEIPNDTVGTSSFTTPSRDSGALMGGISSDEGAVIAVGPGSAFGIGGTGLTSGRTAGPGEGGPLALYGPTPHDGGVRGPVFTTSNGARRVAYVCDASGSMINKMASLKMELEKAVGHLKPIQSFSIIFFQDAKQPEMFDQQLVLATPQSKRKAGVFLEGVTSTGTTDPISGLQAAFRQNPELIYLLTDGDFVDNALVLIKIRELNKDKKVRINTIAFVGSNDNDTAFLDLLKTIASENGGNFKHVSEDSLGE